MKTAVSEITLKEIVKCAIEGLPWGPVVKNLPASAGDVVSMPGPGRLHMWCALQLLNLCSRVQKSELLKPALSLCSATKEAIAMRSLVHHN